MIRKPSPSKTSKNTTNKLPAVRVKQETVPGKYFDDGGLFLLIEPNGTKRWRLKYRIGGVERLLAIGTFPKTSLAHGRDARDAAR